MKSAGPVRPPIAGRLKKARLKKSVSQRRLGILAGIDASSASARINQYERGVHVPDYQTAYRLASCLDVPVTYFYAETESLAELVLQFSKLKKREQAALLAQIKNG